MKLLRKIYYCSAILVSFLTFLTLSIPFYYEHMLSHLHVISCISLFFLCCCLGGGVTFLMFCSKDTRLMKIKPALRGIILLPNTITPIQQKDSQENQVFLWYFTKIGFPVLAILSSVITLSIVFRFSEQTNLILEVIGVILFSVLICWHDLLAENRYKYKFFYLYGVVTASLLLLSFSRITAGIFLASHLFSNSILLQVFMLVSVMLIVTVTNCMVFAFLNSKQKMERSALQYVFGVVGLWVVLSGLFLV